MNYFSLFIILIVPTCIVFCGILENQNFKRDDERDMHPEFLMQSKPNHFKLNREGEIESIFWTDSAKEFVRNQIEKKINENIAKNVIFFLGDGMSMATISASRVYIGGEEKKLFFEEFHDVGLIKTFCVNHQVPDSACTSTSYLTGVNTNLGVLGLTAKVNRFDCKGELDESTHIPSIAKWAMDAGKVAGFVTTTRVTHATPAGLYAHSANRGWENNDDVVKDCGTPNDLDDIAMQLIHGDVGSRLKVIMGGGRREFRNITVRDEENQNGKRTDSRNLVDEWLLQKGDSKKKYIWNKADLLAINGNETDYLLGLFEDTHMQYHLDVLEKNIIDTEPTLEEMVDKAIDVLSKHEGGFFLFVEGGKIDHAHHLNYAHLALDETVEFDKAVKLARNKLSDEDTLIVVTADHSQVMTYVGYADRNNNIFGTAETDNNVLDGNPFLTLSYANGNGFVNHIDTTQGKRIDPTTFDTNANNFLFPSTLPLELSSHAGEDVPIYASGPWSHLFSGAYEQNVIPYLMGYAACVGDGFKNACDDK